MSDHIPEDPEHCPASSTVPWINWTGVFAMLGMAFVMRQFPEVPALLATLLCCLAFALPLIVLEYILLRPKRDPKESISWVSLGGADPGRVMVKLFGLWTTLAIIALAYSVFPEYRGSLFEPFWDVLEYAIPAVLIGSPAYFWWVDGRMVEPKDGYWHLGALMIGWTEQVDLGKLKQHGLGWLVKAFFLPLMFCYFHGNLNHMRQVAIPELSWYASEIDVLAWHRILYDILIFVDVGVIVVGYAMTVRIFDNHIRSTEQTWTGWIPTLICYQPFWGLMGPNYFAYRTEVDWVNIFEGYPVLMIIWAFIILGLMAIYTWGSVSFGLRFSNLTHRGIITNGPYRMCKHPAYVSKNLSWWFEALPFLTPFIMGMRGQGWSGQWSDALGRTIRLVGVNLIYYIRARTEEAHLSRDPIYVRYALWIERNGLFRVVPRYIWFARYTRPSWWIEASERVRIEREKSEDGAA